MINIIIMLWLRWWWWCNSSFIIYNCFKMLHEHKGIKIHILLQKSGILNTNQLIHTRSIM